MAFTKVVDGFYNCLQSDIDIFASPEEGATYFCLDSGATYRGIKEGSYPVVYKLVDIERRKIRSANPICMSQDLPNFTGKRYKIREIPFNLASISDNNIGLKGFISSTGYLSLTERGATWDKIRVIVRTPWNTSLSEGSIKIVSSDDDVIYSSPALTASSEDNVYSVSDVIDLKEFYNQYGRKEIKVEIESEASSGGLIIIDNKWLNHVASDEAIIEKVGSGLYTAYVEDRSSIYNYYGVDNGFIYNFSFVDYNIHELGIFADVKNNKYNFVGSDIKELIAPKPTEKIIPDTDMAAAHYNTEYDVFAAEILD